MRYVCTYKCTDKCTDTHTHTRTYMYIHLYMYISACVQFSEEQRLNHDPSHGAKDQSLEDVCFCRVHIVGSIGYRTVPAGM